MSSASAAAPLLAIVKITVAAPEPDDPGLREAKVTGTSSLNIRSRATTKSRILASAAKGSTLYVLETSGNWAYVRLPDGTEGWARAKYLAA